MVSLICFLSCISPFLVLFLLLLSSSNCLPPVFQICKSLYHRCAVFLVSSFTFSPALPRFPESFVFFCSHPPYGQVLAPVSASAACLHHALKNPVCFPATHKLFQDFTTCALLISLIIPFPKTHSIPRTGLAALRSFCLFVQKLSGYLLLSSAATLGFCFVSQTSSVSLLSTS